MRISFKDISRLPCATWEGEIVICSRWEKISTYRAVKQNGTLFLPGLWRRRQYQADGILLFGNKNGDLLGHPSGWN